MSMRFIAWKVTCAAVAALAVTIVVPVAAYGSSSSGGAKISIESSPAGNVLVVGGTGAGMYPAGSALYTPTIDPAVGSGQKHSGYSAGCNAKTKSVSNLEESMDPSVKAPYPPFTCAGSEIDQYADWPAFTTKGAPIAGAGVHKNLLGTVYRSDLHANQVTYAGQPLYLFDPGPNSFAGENFIETVSPLFPWHTLWYLISPNGRVNPGPAKLTSVAPQSGTSYSSDALAVQVLPAVGGVPVTVYSFSRDTSRTSQCSGSCARQFMPVLTNGAPTGSGVSGRLGTLTRSDGTHQVTYNGHPLYLYSRERPLILSLSPPDVQSAGNANGMHAFGGTFRVVSP